MSNKELVDEPSARIFEVGDIVKPVDSYIADKVIGIVLEVRKNDLIVLSTLLSDMDTQVEYIKKWLACVAR